MQLLNDLELAGQAILVKVGKKEQPSLEAFLNPEDKDDAKKHQTHLDSVKKKVRWCKKKVPWCKKKVPWCSGLDAVK